MFLKLIKWNQRTYVYLSTRVLRCQVPVVLDKESLVLGTLVSYPIFELGHANIKETDFIDDYLNVWSWNTEHFDYCEM